jgi:hypothetical protein
LLFRCSKSAIVPLASRGQGSGRFVAVVVFSRLVVDVRVDRVRDRLVGPPRLVLDGPEPTGCAGRGSRHELLSTLACLLTGYRVGIAATSMV